jgi:uncharacterized protein YkwD
MRLTIYSLLALMFFNGTMSGGSVQKRGRKVPGADLKGAPPVTSPKSQIVSNQEGTLDEINRARTNPAEYLKFLEEFKKFYRGREIHYPDGSVLVSNEGTAVVDEAIAFMRTLKPGLPLMLNTGMVRGANDHLNDLIKTGGFGHRGSDGSSTGDRLDRYGSWMDSLGEDIVYQSRTAREDVISLIIDDGTPTRGHRKNIFNSQFHVIGIARSEPLKRTLCVITFAGGYQNKPGR